MKKALIFPFVGILIGLLVSCAPPKISYTIVKPPSMKIGGIEYIEIGTFLDELRAPVATTAKISNKLANVSSSSILKSQIEGFISEGGSFKLVNAKKMRGAHIRGGNRASKTGIIRARVRFHGSNHHRFVQSTLRPDFTVINDGRDQEDALASLLTMVISKMQNSPHRVDIPAMEKLALVEVDFDFVKKNTGEKIIPTQSFSLGYYGQWGAESSANLLTQSEWQALLKIQPKKWHGKMRPENWKEIQASDPAAYQASGFHLRLHEETPMSDQEIQSMLLEQIAFYFAQKISKVEVVAELSPASGKEEGETLIHGGAFEEAINFYLNLNELEAADQYNLALAYEALGDYPQAKRNYEIGKERFPDSNIFPAGLKRLQ